MRTTLLKTLAVITLSLALPALAIPAFAEFQESSGSSSYAGNQFNDRGMIRQAETQSDDFAALLDERDNALSQRAHDLTRQLDLARSESEQGSSFHDVRSQLASAMSVAQGIDAQVRNYDMGARVDNQWSLVRDDLNRVCRAYDLGYIGSRPDRY